jgi:glycosyltransferase involved in cell wall biosynthesis
MPSAYAPAVGGVEELSERLAQQLIGSGHRIEVWTHRHPPELPAVDTIRGITIRRFVMPLPTAKIRKALQFGPGVARALAEMGRARRAFAPDVLHVQCFSANGVYASALAALFRVPLVVTLQGETVMDDNDIYQHSASLRLGLRVGLRRAATVTGCSQFVLDDAVRRFGLAPQRGVIVPNGFQVGDGAVAPGLALPFERFVLGLGRVVEKKGFDLLINAFALVADDHPEVGLVIGGNGAARPGLLAQVQRLGLSDRVVLPGMLSRDEVAWAMHHAAVFVLPSRIEPFGIVVLEALSAGRPVIVSDRGGATEIVSDGKDGLVVDPFDSQALAAAIGRLLEDDGLRTRFTEAGRARVRDFAWDAVTARYTALYQEVAPGAAAASVRSSEPEPPRA